MGFPVSTTCRALRWFLGMAGYYRSFCQNFSTIVQPLTNLLRPGIDFVWTPECQTAFDCVKSILCHSPILRSPAVSRPFKLEVDTSPAGAQAVLIQEDSEGIDYPICYFSRKFNIHQLQCSTISNTTN